MLLQITPTSIQLPNLHPPCKQPLIPFSILYLCPTSSSPLTKSCTIQQIFKSLYKHLQLKEIPTVDPQYTSVPTHMHSQSRYFYVAYTINLSITSIVSNVTLTTNAFLAIKISQFYFHPSPLIFGIPPLPCNLTRCTMLTQFSISISLS